MKGYKATNPNMTCRDYQFELGKTYSIEGELLFCHNGFHFCTRHMDVYNYYSPKDSRIFEVEASGKIESESDKNCCETITFIRELSRQEIEQTFETALLTSNFDDRLNVAIAGYGLDRLINDPHEAIRCIVAQQKYHLNQLTTDSSETVRATVAEQRHNLDILVSDPSPLVRSAVARQDYRLDVLINDPHWTVRGTVASRGHGLDVLINDQDLIVRNIAHRNMIKIIRL